MAKNEHTLDIREDGTYTIDGIPHTDDEILKRSTIVYIEEEYGYRHWVWVTPFTKEELISWWQNLDSVMRYFFHAAGDLPGMTLESVNTPIEAIREMYKDDEDSNIGQYLDNLFRPTMFEVRNDPIWYCHLHCDDDSILIDPERNRYTHAGYETEDMDEDHPTVKANQGISDQARAEYLRSMTKKESNE